MKPAPFTYHRPETLAEAVRLLAELAPHDGRILAGGQSLVPIMAFRLARPAHLIDINTVAGLDVLAVRDEVLHITGGEAAVEGVLGLGGHEVVHACRHWS